MMNDSTAMAAPVPALKVARKENYLILVVMLLGLINGLIFVFIMPPWQHYEEPSHFEYAWLIAARHSLPQYPAYDQAKRREIAASMIEHGFFNDLGFLPDLNSQTQPIWIGTNVTGALPLYHIYEALPLLFILNANVDTQLYVDRIFSLILYLLTLWLAYKVLCEFVPAGHPLRWIVPGSMALIPGFADLMTAVNNDVGATFVFSLFLLACVRMVLRGLSVRRVVTVLITAAVCAVTKNTILVAVPLALLAFVLAMRRSRWWYAAWAVCLAGLLAVILSVFSWGDAFLWNRNSSQLQATHSKTLLAPVGRYAIDLETFPGANETASVNQVLLSDQVNEIKGKTVTIGAWIWASEPTKAYLPVLNGGNLQLEAQVSVDKRPTFFSSKVIIPADADRVSVILQSIPSPAQKTGINIFYDGIILLEGNWPNETAPVFKDAGATHGAWGARSFTNLIRNASAEQASPFVRPWLEKLSKRFPWAAHLSPTQFVNALLDLQNSGWIYRATASSLYRSFWGDFAWESVRLPAIVYTVLKWFTLLSILSSCLALWIAGSKKSINWILAMGWVGLAMLIIWVSVFIRGLPSLFGQIYIPPARYAYPAIIPTIMFLSLGWFIWIKRLHWQKWGVYPFLAGFLILNVIAIITITNFYY